MPTPFHATTKELVLQTLSSRAQAGLSAQQVTASRAVANLAPVPDCLTDEQAADCCDMLSTGFVGVEHANIPIGGSVAIPREAWGVGMSDKTIRTALCPDGSELMSHLMRLIEARRVDPLPLTTHRFSFKDIEKAFRTVQTKEYGMIKPLISFV